MEKTSTVIWAVDPFAMEPLLQREAGAAIRAFTRNSNVRIEPVYVWSSAVPGETPSFLVEQMQSEAEERFKPIVAPLHLTNLGHLKVLPRNRGSLRDRVGMLLEYASDSGASLIALSTHAKKGLKRFVVGSFAETLMLQSDIPLLSVNPDCKAPLAIGHILFPTDFSRESLIAFEHVIEQAQRLGAKVTIFHQFGSFVIPTIDFAHSAQARYEGAYRLELKHAHEHAQKLAQRAQRTGVDVDVHIETDSVRSVSDSLIAWISERPGMIAMAAHSGPMDRLLLGSTTRWVMRDCPFPVWVIHPRAEELRPLPAS